MSEKCYGIKGQERLCCGAEDVVLEVFEECSVEDFEFPLKIYVSKRQEISLSGKSLLEDILENLDENYGDPDGDLTSPTDEMIRASDMLAEVIKKDYICWMCEPTGEVLEFNMSDVLPILKKYNRLK